MANRVLETFRRCYSWALSRDYVAATPFTGIERPAPKTRATRTFSNDEIPGHLRLRRRLTTPRPCSPDLPYRHAQRRDTLHAVVARRPRAGGLAASETEAAQDLPLNKGALAVLKRVRAAQQRDAKVVPITSVDFVFPGSTGNPPHRCRPPQEGSWLRSVR